MMIYSRTVGSPADAIEISLIASSAVLPLLSTVVIAGDKSCGWFDA